MTEPDLALAHIERLYVALNSLAGVSAENGRVNAEIIHQHLPSIVNSMNYILLRLTRVEAELEQMKRHPIMATWDGRVDN